MAKIVRAVLSDPHRKESVNVQLVAEVPYSPQVRRLLSGLDYCPDDVVSIWKAVSESDVRCFLEMKTGEFEALEVVPST